MIMAPKLGYMIVGHALHQSRMILPQRFQDGHPSSSVDIYDISVSIRRCRPVVKLWTMSKRS